MKKTNCILVASVILNIVFVSIVMHNKKEMSKLDSIKAELALCESKIDSIESQRVLSNWEIMQLGLIKVESQGNPNAVSCVGARGIFQLMPIYVDEVNRLCKMHHINKHFTFDDAYDESKSFEMFNIMNTYHNTNADEYKRIEQVIKKHNPGAGAWYSQRVYKAMFEIMTDEEVKNDYIKYLDFV